MSAFKKLRLIGSRSDIDPETDRQWHVHDPANSDPSIWVLDGPPRIGGTLPFNGAYEIELYPDCSYRSHRDHYGERKYKSSILDHYRRFSRQIRVNVKRTNIAFGILLQKTAGLPNAAFL